MSTSPDPAFAASSDAPAVPAADRGIAEDWAVRLEDRLGALESLAGELEGQPEALLMLLRRLEQLHRAIQDGPFRSSLPADRGALFQVLSEMERSGGWPYIPRLQLRTFLDLLGSEVAEGLLADSEPPAKSAESDEPPSLAA
jgi:hypothetical protein